MENLDFAFAKSTSRSVAPYGARFRVKASYEISQLSPPARVVAPAMQKYGMFLADDGNIAPIAHSDMDTKTKHADLEFGD